MTGAAQSVTVVIPTRNRWDLLERMSLVAARSQEDVDVEVIVVDDASSEPPSGELLSAAGDAVRVVRHPERRGVAAARNTGIAEASGDWIALLDDDDGWSPRKLRKQLDTAEASGADFVYASAVSIDDEGRALQEYPAPDPTGLGLELLSRCVIPAGSSNLLVRSELIRSLGGFDESFDTLEDWDCWIRIASAGAGAAVPDVLVAYLEHVGARSLGFSRDGFGELRRLERKHAALRRRQNVHLDSLGFMHYAAWLHLRRRQYATASAIYLRSAVANRRASDLRPALRFAAQALVPTRVRKPRPAQASGVSRPEWLERYA